MICLHCNRLRVHYRRLCAGPILEWCVRIDARNPDVRHSNDSPDRVFGFFERHAETTQANINLDVYGCGAMHFVCNCARLFKAGHGNQKT